MQHFIDAILSLPTPLLDHWGYWVVLLFSLLEASPLIGIFIPGQTIVVLGGLVSRLGILDLGDVILLAFIGAICGDLIGYLLGRKFGYPFISKYGRFKKYLDKVKGLMTNHAGKALLIGRFTSIARSFAPFVAGASEVPFWKFMGYNFLGGIAWAAAFALVGYIFEASYEVAAQYMGRFFTAAVIFSVIMIFAYRFINKRKHIFTKYYLHIFILNIFSLYLFSKMLEDVVDGEKIVQFDLWVSERIAYLWHPILNKIMMVITDIGGPAILSLLSVIVLVLLLRKRKFYNSFLFCVGMVGGYILETLFKWIVHRARPGAGIIGESGFSFPSGHATMAIIFFCLLLYVFNSDIKNRIWNNIFSGLAILIFLLVGFSRVYLNVHWASDVIGGFALGLFWLTFLILVFKTLAFLIKNTVYGNLKRIFE